MESRPWCKKVTQYFKRKNQVTPTLSVHEFPLSEPKPPPQKVNQRAIRVSCRKMLKKRVVGQVASTDPRFNHSLRRVKRIDIDTKVETYPDPDMHLS